MFHVQQRPLASVIEVGDDLDAFSSPALDRAITLAESASTPIVVSLEQCAYCDSSALGVLIRAKRRLDDRLYIVVPEDAMARRIFEIADLIDVLEIIENVPTSLVPPMAS